MLLDKITVNLNKTVEYKGKHHSYEFILLDNVRNLSNYVVGISKTLTFNIPYIQIALNDPTKLRDQILNMTSEERRKLGIRRNTLWYIKNNLKEGRQIKIYNRVMKEL